MLIADLGRLWTCKAYSKKDLVFKVSSSVCSRSSEACRIFLHANSLWFWWRFSFFQPLSHGARRSCECLWTEALLIPGHWAIIIRFLSLVSVHDDVKLGLYLKPAPNIGSTFLSTVIFCIRHELLSTSPKYIKASYVFHFVIL